MTPPAGPSTTDATVAEVADRPAAGTDVVPGDATTPAEPGDALAPAATTAAEAQASRSHRQRPTSAAFRELMASGWAPADEAPPARAEVAPYAAARRAAVSRLFPGERLVLPAGPLKTRSNDSDYRFRAHSAFAHLTGLGGEREPDAVLVLDPRDGGAGADAEDAGHEAVLLFRPRTPRTSEEFFADSRYGEFWVGARPSLADAEAETGLVCRDVAELDDLLAAGGAPLRVVPDADPALAARVAALRGGAGVTEEAGALADDELVVALSELRLVKDEHEVAQMRLAVAASVHGFEDVVRSLPRAVGHVRGERVVEGAFGARAREEGGGTGYETIAAAGEHACTLHWTRNDGVVRSGDLLLLDAGVEAESLYTADITRTLPVDGRFTPAQRRVYEAVLDAADASFAVARPGSRFRDLHEAAMQVVAARLHDWGLIPVPLEEALSERGGQHRRWMVHGTSHHLGIDVHDCAQARREMYLDAVLEPGMVFTIEPGLYFKGDDELVPAELRGIGVRIEDDVLVTEDGCENLSAALPRRADDVEAWMASLRA
ncbi:aminopeptidase P family protein [Pseudokineococcus lusitanus]|uniref:Xaa-Pro aminopeptidase n=1 Tax=Pseudokineococcus lusitanus TaxID=763993 RepID=A0A3N1HN99_9ACTN|nr:aminopeptidase P family protein [Pseudokineococcus lusitanus]ROP43929.1 Xaa-Pro aminopeptidase [Pseudokineococcus lusitanus]